MTTRAVFRRRDVVAYVGRLGAVSATLAAVGRWVEAAAQGEGSAGAEALLPMTVYKQPTCACCRPWVKYIEAAGFVVEVVDLPDVGPTKEKLKVPVQLRSCHTAVVEGYVIEGHVPAGDIRRLLAERPDVTGLAVPGMPVGAPGMEGPEPESYSVIAFGDAGQLEFAAYRADQTPSEE